MFHFEVSKKKYDSFRNKIRLSIFLGCCFILIAPVLFAQSLSKFVDTQIGTKGKWTGLRI